MMVLDRPLAALDLVGISAIAQAVRTGRISARALVENRLERIDRYNPRLNAFTRILHDRAFHQAAWVDSMVAEGRDPGPLAGVPFGVKDNYDVAGEVTTAGSIINRDLSVATADAVLVQRLAAAGAVLVGTQNMDEYAYGFTTENVHYGSTRNPLDQQRSAGGSSGGSAASVAAQLCEFALGTDTNGSVRVPASFCGIFGLKPTFGRLPRTGTFPFVHDLDHLGIFARSTSDLASVYDATQGWDVGDAACAPIAPAPTSPAGATFPSARIGLLDGWFDRLADGQGRDAARRVGSALGTVARVNLPDAEQARAAAFVLTAASGGNLHRDNLRRRAAEFDPATRDRLLAGLLLPADAVLAAQRVRSLFLQQALDAFRRHDLLIAPATPTTAPMLGQPTIRVDGQDLPTRPNIGLLTQPISFIGLPVVCVPVVNGLLPIGVQIIAPPWQEALAIQAAAHLERLGVVAAASGDAC